MPQLASKTNKIISISDYRKIADDCHGEVYLSGKLSVVICREGAVLTPDQKDAFSTDSLIKSEHAKHKLANHTTHRCEVGEEIASMADPRDGAQNTYQTGQFPPFDRPLKKGRPKVITWHITRWMA